MSRNKSRIYKADWLQDTTPRLLLIWYGLSSYVAHITLMKFYAIDCVLRHNYLNVKF